MISASIIDYLGKYENGIIVSLSLLLENTYHNAIFYYTSDKMIITVDDSLNDILNNDIQNTDHYIPLMESIINMVQPYDEIINDIKDYNFD